MDTAGNSRGLTYGQILVLICGFLGASVVIFLFGVWLGHDLATRNQKEHQGVVSLPAPTVAGRTPAIVEEDVDREFYEKLKETAVQRLQQTVTPESQVEPPTPTVPPPPSATMTRPPTATVAVKPTPRPTRTPALKSRPMATVTTRIAPDEEWADAGWTVQAFATKESDKAIELTLRLRSKGFDAYTVQVPLRGETWYRVRVGRFDGRADASALAERLKREEGLSNAFVTPR